MIDIEHLIQYVEIPFKSHGRDREGLDCYGLVCLVYKELLGLTLQSWSHLYNDAHRVNPSSVQQGFDQWQKVDKPLIGDLALFQAGRGMHVGICLDRKGVQMLHTTEGVAVSVEKISSPHWSKRFRGFYHYKGICND